MVVRLAGASVGAHNRRLYHWRVPGSTTGMVLQAGLVCVNVYIFAPPPFVPDHTRHLCALFIGVGPTPSVGRQSNAQSSSGMQLRNQNP